MDGVKLKFTPEALLAIAQAGPRAQSGARGLRAILESAMLDIMYEIPSRTGVKEVVVNEEVIMRREQPLIVYEKEQTPSSPEASLGESPHASTSPATTAIRFRSPPDLGDP
jgi:ATP-dependent protease Clp ATPase subunit